MHHDYHVVERARDFDMFLHMNGFSKTERKRIQYLTRRLFGNLLHYEVPLAELDVHFQSLQHCDDYDDGSESDRQYSKVMRQETQKAMRAIINSLPPWLVLKLPNDAKPHITFCAPFRAHPLPANWPEKPRISEVTKPE